MTPLPYRQVHLDFHTSEHIAAVACDFDPRQFAETLRAAHVNSVTCFARCHHGMIYYDTRFADARHPGLRRDLLAEQIEACHAVGIRVPIYVSVGFDEHQARLHPDWVGLDPRGRPQAPPPGEAGWKKLCFNSPYIDYVWEQTREVLERFDVDGLFFDIMFQDECTCEHCAKAARARGLDLKLQADRLRLCHETVNDLRRRFHRAIRELNKDCTIFFNRGHVEPAIREVLECYTHLELESLPSGGWGYLHFPLTTRYARGLGLPVVGMTGKFHKSWGDFNSLKTPAALQYECFNMLAEGAACSVGDQLHPSGRLDAATYDLIGGVYREVERKEPWCVGARSVADIAILTPEAVNRHDDRVDSAAAGALRMLRESHHPCDVVDVESDWSAYRLLITPDKITCDESLRRKIDAFVAAGGALMLSHESGMNVERSAFVLDVQPVTYVGPAERSPEFVRVGAAIGTGVPDAVHVLYERGLDVRPKPGAEVLAEIWTPYFQRSAEHFCSHSHTPPAEPTGRPAVAQAGRVVYVSHPIFGLYGRHGAVVYKQIVLNCISRLLDAPLVRADAPTTAHLMLTHQPEQRRYVLHVVHYLPQRRHPEFDTLEDVIPLHDVHVAVRLSGVRRARLVPEDTPLAIETDGPYVALTIPHVRGHQMVALEER